MLNSLWPVLPALIPLDPRRITAEVCGLLCKALSAAPGALQPVLSDIVSFMQEAAGHNLVACTELLAVLVERETEALGDNMPRLLEGAFSLALSVIEEVRGMGCFNDICGDDGRGHQNVESHPLLNLLSISHPEFKRSHGRYRGASQRRLSLFHILLGRHAPDGICKRCSRRKHHCG